MSEEEKVNRLDIRDFPEYRNANCQFEMCKKENIKFKTIKELMDHCEERHSVDLTIFDFPTFNCNWMGDKTTCRLTFETDESRAIHRGIRHFSGARFGCDYCHYGKYIGSC